MNRAAILLLLMIMQSTSVYAEAPLGRLFFTPQQRNALDLARQHSSNLDTAHESEPDSITLNGVIKRSDGQHIVWINQRAFSDRSTVERVSVSRDKNSGRYTVQLPYSDKRVQLKVGQSMEATSGKVDEAYHNKATLKQPKPAESPPLAETHSASPRTPRHKDKPDEMTEYLADH